MVVGEVCRLLAIAGRDGAQQRSVLAHMGGDCGQAVQEQAEDPGGEIVVAPQYVAESGLSAAS